MNDENIRGYVTTEYDKTRWRLYSANLELFLASSLARSFALNELNAVTKKDFGYNTNMWREFLNTNKNFAVTPLKKDFEI